MTPRGVLRLRDGPAARWDAPLTGRLPGGAGVRGRAAPAPAARAGHQAECKLASRAQCQGISPTLARGYSPPGTVPDGGVTVIPVLDGYSWGTKDGWLLTCGALVTET
jgi:hypothetical protein